MDRKLTLFTKLVKKYLPKFPIFLGNNNEEKLYPDGISSF